jgi:hypothetical protein
MIPYQALKKLEMFRRCLHSHIHLHETELRGTACHRLLRLEAAAIDTGAWAVGGSSLPIRLARETVRYEKWSNFTAVVYTLWKILLERECWHYPKQYFFLWLYSPIQAFAASMKFYVSLRLLEIGQSEGPLGRVISSSQGLNLYTNTEIGTNTKHPCPEWHSNPRSRRPRERRQFMPYTARLPWPALGTNCCLQILVKNVTHEYNSD